LRWQDILWLSRNLKKLDRDETKFQCNDNNSMRNKKMKDWKLIFGPRIPKELLMQERKRFILPTFMLGFAAVLLLVSIFLPYWKLTLMAPQYPQGLKMEAYVNHVGGDVDEIDELNHYIGMRPLKEAAELERSASIIMIVALILLVLGSIYTHSPFALFLLLPAILYPVIFIGDMYFWMHDFGMHLNPHAPLSNAVKPFVPPIIGEGLVGQFKTIASWQVGLILSFAASLLIIVGLYYHRKAYKPLMEMDFKNFAAEKA
jgi:hypothetical protein